MIRLCLTGPPLCPRGQLAMDEAVLNLADASRHPPALRTWQFDRPVVVLGRSSKWAVEVDHGYCDRQNIPVLRRVTGGASVVGGAGCLMYSVVISLEEHPHLRHVDAAHEYVIRRVLTAVQRQQPDAQWQGICDLTWQNKKFSGNSLRITRGHLLYHGTILHAADLDQIASCLAVAPRQPEYRQGRRHRQFITNVPCEPSRLAEDLANEFSAHQSLTVATDDSSDPRVAMTDQLRRERYDSDAWHQRH
ncbi:lipoate--protein ligase family protein [Crateriforma conspicua]|uniref:lipoate--protein ligase family protein n=1 Tax=Crateriforma conspicua TaxID=2527996 RepID=UPI001188C3B4|nr:hypothetical protein [Crateriforma conspicua]QDV61794.1 putative lipoate-protein ligase A [Crateriforma conspicua]